MSLRSSCLSGAIHGFPALVVLAAVPISGAPVSRQEAHYRALTNNVRNFTNFNPEVVRGFVVDGDDVYSVNSYESTIVHHAGLAAAAGVSAPTQRWRTLNNPVSIALYGGDLFVVGQGNHALARHSKVDGRLLDVLALPSEPADVVIDAENALAWVSCMGADTVVQVSVAGPAMTIVARWSWADGLRLKRPRFLWLDLGEPGPADNSVCVAPLVSGNNTLITNHDPAASPPTPDSELVEPTLRSGSDVALFPAGGLPDEDLFRIRPAFPLAPMPVPGGVDALVRGAGSLILAHGQHPQTGEYWLLNVQHKNLDPTLPPNEPGLRGQFAVNRLTRAVLSPTSIVRPTTMVNLDDYDPVAPGNLYARNRSVSFPYALDFDVLGGRAAIAGATSPVVVLTDSSGARTGELRTTLRPSAMPGAAGLVPRTLRFVGSKLLVYCQQTTNLQVWDVGGAIPAWNATLSLGNDPTPAAVKKGRAIFYDGVPSKDGRTSCNSCHPQGGADGLVWQIENSPVDHKQPMVTQPLFGIEDTFPYHWRGERALADFNGAFPGLLGHDAPLDTSPGGKLDQFLEFLFSLTPPANPLESLDRKLRDSDAFDQLVIDLQPPSLSTYDGEPLNGDFLFHDATRRSDSNGHCALCHMDPTGTNGDFNVEAESSIATRSVMKVAHLDNQLRLKQQPLVDVDWTGAPASFRSNLLGSGLMNSGQVLNIPEFVDLFFGSQSFQAARFSAQESADVAAFLMLFDTGTAPAVHHVARLNSGSTPAEIADVQRYLIDQALPRTAADPRGGGVGIVVLGRFPLGSGAVDMSWYFDPLAVPPVFVPADAQPLGPGGPTLTPQPFSAFQNTALADNVFLGTPPGNERRLGADYDDDGLDLLAERQAGADPWNPDSDGDTWSDGTEVANGSSPSSPGGTPPNVSLPALLTDASGANVEIDFVNASQVKLRFRTTEPARWAIKLNGTSTSPTGGHALPAASGSRLTFDVLHTAVVQDLEPSTMMTSPMTGQFLSTTNTYSGDITLFDEHGASATYPLVFRSSTCPACPGFDSASNLPLETVGKRPIVVKDIQWEFQNRPTGGFEGKVRVTAAKRIDGPDLPPNPGRVVVAQILKQVITLEGIEWEIVPAADILPFDQSPGATDVRNPAPNYDASGLTSISHLNFQIDGGARWYWQDPSHPDVLKGPFLVLSPTTLQGETWSDFRLTNIDPDQKVLFNILAIDNQTTGYDAQAPVLLNPLTRYQMPATPTPLRALESTL